MNCVLCAKMDKGFSFKKIEKYWKMEKLLNKSGNFVSLEKWKPGLTKSQILYSETRKHSNRMCSHHISALVGPQVNMFEQVSSIGPQISPAGSHIQREDRPLNSEVPIP